MPPTMLCIIDVISVRAIGYQRDGGEWCIVESSNPRLLPFGKHVSGATVREVASPGSRVRMGVAWLTFSHMAPGPNGWVAMVSNRESVFATDPFKLESVE